MEVLSSMIMEYTRKEQWPADEKSLNEVLAKTLRRSGLSPLFGINENLIVSSLDMMPCLPVSANYVPL